MIGICCETAQRLALGCGGNRVHLSRRIVITLFCCVERIVGDVHQHIAGGRGDCILAQVRSSINVGFPVQVCQRVINSVNQFAVRNVSAVCCHRYGIVMGFARLWLGRGMRIRRCALQIGFGSGDCAGAGNGCAAVLPEHLSAECNHLAAAGDRTVVQFDCSTALGIHHGAFAAVNRQNSAIIQRQRAAYAQTRLADLGAACIAADEHLSLDLYVAGGHNDRLMRSTVGQIAVCEIVRMRVDCRVFQNRAILHAELSADGRTSFIFLVVGVVVHRECAATLHINDALHGGVPQRQFAAVFHHDADAAEDLHIHQGQITAVGDIQGLGNVAGFHIVPRNIIAQNAVGAAFMGTVPNLQFLRHANAVFFTVHIAAEVFNGPRLHDIPCVEAALILFQIFDFDLVGQRFLTGVDAEGQGITIRGAALIVLNMNGHQITARVLRRTIQRQVTAESHVDAFHAAVSIGFRSIRSARYDADEALAAIQTDFRMMIQESGSKAACRGGSINF